MRLPRGIFGPTAELFSGANVPKALIVEDDADALDRLEQWLKHERYTVEGVKDGNEALDRLRLCKYDVIVLDWNLPHISGVELCKQFRSLGGVTPILMLTGRSAVNEKATGLDAGADDYLTKPFDLVELSARLRALLRRSSVTPQNTVLSAGPVLLDCAAHSVTVDGKAISLLPLEFSLLEFLMRHPGQIFSHTALVDHVWKAESSATSEAVRTCVMTLRKKIAVAGQPSVIKTVHGVGYKLES